MAQQLVTSGDYRFQATEQWAQWPADWDIHEVSSIATDSQDRVYVFNRSPRPVAVFDREGQFLHSWGEGMLSRAHGIYIDAHDMVYCVDDLGHTVSKFTSDGELLFRIGTPGKPSDTGATSIDYRTIKYVGPPFNFPTNLAVAPTGELYVADGYGNARIHKFSETGELIFSWGAPGSGPGEFQVPHGIAISHNGTVFIADRENSRLQLFSPAGEFLTEWTEIARPCDVKIAPDGNVYVAELGYRAGMWSGTVAPFPGATGGRVSIFNPEGKLLARFGGGEAPYSAGDFFAPHAIWLDSRGDFYLAEVCYTASRNVPPEEGRYHTLQKFSRI
ncbi:MAG: peptidyl-alpha-hydroxyglycine alpha-amidating lyase family protein [Planctomycetota bacterium]